MTVHGKRKGKLRDGLESIGETGLEVASDNVNAILPTAAELGIAGAAGLVVDGLIGSIAPGLTGAIFNYRMKRAERNLREAIDEFSENLETINGRLDRLDAQTREKFYGPYGWAFLDSIVEENQLSKVGHCTNAFINVMAVSGPTDDLVYTLFADLTDLTELDLRVLRLHNWSPFEEEVSSGRDSLEKLLADENIDYGQYQTVRQKLARHGLLASENDKRRDENLDAVAETVTNLAKQTNGKNVKAVKPPKLKRINSSDSFRITKLGRQYVEFIQSAS